MDIARLNIRITFQKNEVYEDEIGNHLNRWTNCFSCHATASTKIGETESESVAQTIAKERIDFTVRYCKEVSMIEPGTHRILLGDRVYNIISVDDMAFKHKSLKFHAELVRRQE